MREHITSCKQFFNTLGCTCEGSSKDIVEFNELKAKISEFVGPTEQITVTDAASNAIALGTLKTIKTLSKEIETRRTALVKPLNDQVKEINAYAGAISAPLDRAEAEIKRKMAAWAAQERARIAAEEQRIREQEKARLAEIEKKKKEDEAALAAFGVEENEEPAPKVAPERAVAMETKSQVSLLKATQPTNVRLVPKWAIVDPAKVPDVYWVIDEVALGRVIRSGVRDIPGVEIKMVEEIVVR